MQTETIPQQAPEYNSLKYVMAAYLELLQTEQEMNSHAQDDDTATYYKIEERLKSQLVAFLRLNFIYLSTRELLKLCALVSKHRPVQPFSFLVTCSNLISDL